MSLIIFKCENINVGQLLEQLLNFLYFKELHALILFEYDKVLQMKYESKNNSINSIKIV